MFFAFQHLLRHLVREGELAITDAGGATHVFGSATADLTSVHVRLHDRRLERQLVLDPQLALGEAYVTGRLTLEAGSIYDLLALLLSNAERAGLPAWTYQLDTVRFVWRRLAQFNPQPRARANVAHHYDITGALYDLFLDGDRQYSCAYFANGSTGLDVAQRAKQRHLAAKLDIRPGHRVLDIGSGWGGLGLYLARLCDADVTGVTLSEEQLRTARQRAEREGLSRRVRFALEDYRAHRGRYDRIVSVGMFEHVGVPHYLAYFRRINDLLETDGVALVHTIGRSEPPAITNPFIAKYIFPGGYIPAFSEVVSAVERAGLIVTDVEVLRLHYAETLRAWRTRFLARRSEAAALTDEAFCRMWEYYLASSETAFRFQKLVVFQIQLAKRIDTLPITRDYISAAEMRLAQRERGVALQQPMAGA
jgi:cyclopropane-fatty-acyl-phospholipid synthase